MRGVLALLRSAKTWALMDERDHVLPDDVQAVLPAVAAASPDVAARYTEAIVTCCESLRTFPLRGAMRDDVRPGLRFAIREGGRTVGAGVVAKIIE